MYSPSSNFTVQKMLTFIFLLFYYNRDVLVEKRCYLMNYLEFLNARLSVREFDPKHVIRKSIIEEMVRNAANAPLSINFQLWKYLLLFLSFSLFLET